MSVNPFLQTGRILRETNGKEGFPYYFENRLSK